MQENFWEQDRTTLEEKTGWFGSMRGLRKACFILILIFVMTWGLYAGFAFASQGAEEANVLTGADVPDSEWRDVVPAAEGVKVLLLVGADRRDGDANGNSDTMLLAFLNFNDHSIKLLSIPRDTYIQVPRTNRKNKINSTFNSGSITLLKETLEDLTSIKIDHYAIVDFEGFADLIDSIGGIEIDVEDDFYNYNEQINIVKGLQTLNGKDALGYVRYREKVYADWGRMERQQKFITATLQQLKNNFNLTKVPALVGIANTYVQTDLNLWDAAILAKQAWDYLDFDSITTYTVPGKGVYINQGSRPVNYVVIYKNQFITMLEEITGGPLQGTPHIVSDDGQGTETPTYPLAEEDEAGVNPNDPDANITDPANPDNPANPDDSGSTPPETGGEEPTGETPPADNPEDGADLTEDPGDSSAATQED